MKCPTCNSETVTTLLNIALVISIIVFCSTVLVAFIFNQQEKMHKTFDVLTCEALMQEITEEEIRRRLP